MIVANIVRMIFLIKVSPFLINHPPHVIIWLFPEITFAEVKRQLAQEEHEKVAKGDTLVDFEGLSPGEFIVAGLDLEHTQ